MKRDLGLPLIGCGAVGVGALVAAAVLEFSPAVVALVVGVCALAATVCVVVLRTARRIARAQARMEKLITENHKRASVWNYRLTEAVGNRPTSVPAGRAPKNVVTHGGGAVADWGGHPQAALLASSRTFDAEVYSALVGGQFDSAQDAASHYLTMNASKGVMPSPLLDRESLPDPVRSGLSRADIKPLLSFLRSPEVYDRPLSALFDPRSSGIGYDQARMHVGGVLGAYLDSSSLTAPAPVPASSVFSGATIAATRSALVDHAKAVHAGAELSRSREQSTWDHEAERRWLADLRRETTGVDLPSVSVVMPVKNRAGVVGRAIASVQNQTHGRWQLVVVDDGSTDDTVAVVEAIAESDPRVMLVRGLGTGVSSARNLGIETATGRYVAFLDSDNEWRSGFLETMLRGMLRDDIAAAYSAVALNAGESTRYRAFVGDLADLRILNHIDLNVLVVRDDVIAEGPRFDESLRRWVDHDFAIKVASHSVPTLLPFIGCEYDHSEESSDRITVRESDHWQWVALARHWVDWTDAKEPREGLLSVVIPTYNDSEMTIQAVRSVLQDASSWNLDVEVIVVDNGSRLEIGQEILSDIGAAPKVLYRRLPRNMNFAIGCNVGAVLASGAHILFLNNDTVVRDGTLKKLVDAMDDPAIVGAQPLLVYADETIQTAGTAFTTTNSFPSHLLTGQPPADALELADAKLDAVTAAALIMRARDVRELRGFDPIFVNGMEDVDLCLRARGLRDGHFAVVPTALVTHLESKTPGRGANVDENRRLFLERWTGSLPSAQHELFRQAGFMIAHVGTDSRIVPGPRPVVVRDPKDARLRWGLKISSIPGAGGDLWGDTHFAESLRVSLEKLGHRAVVHRHGAHDTPAAAMDDVVLVIRGIDRVKPMPGKVNILWVISHPDDVSLDELREFNLVFAASVSWASKMSVRSGRPVVPMLQATDVSRFHDEVVPVPLGVPVFVGGTHHGRSRPVVRAAIDGGVDLAVYGPGWDGQLPQGVLRGQYVDNSELAAYYRGSSAVLADHWDLMAAEGFIQNRIFDAVASGCRVISDPVDGLEETFGGAARAYRSAEELVSLCSAADDGTFPSETELRKISTSIRDLHSFDRRAQELAAAVKSIQEGI